MALCLALTAFALVPIPVNANDQPVLPAVALDQVALYRLEAALMVFYGALLLITPAFSGLVDGRLPIEISARGARFADDAEESAEATKAAISDLERSTINLSDGLTAAKLKIERLDELARRDNSQPKVDSQ